jgi:hypothetical protein
LLKLSALIITIQMSRENHEEEIPDFKRQIFTHDCQQYYPLSLTYTIVRDSALESEIARESSPSAHHAPPLPAALPPRPPKESIRTVAAKVLLHLHAAAGALS